jgi:hypothetical protein
MKSIAPSQTIMRGIIHLTFWKKWFFVPTISFMLLADSLQSATCRYIGGKVELIDSTMSGSKSISILELNSSILPEHIVCTAQGSRTELRDDGIIIRLGANTVAKRGINGTYWIHSGSLLFCSTVPTTAKFSSLQSSTTFHGRGTIIIETTGNGGFKLIPLEVKGYFTTEKGGRKEAKAAQLLFVIDKPSTFGDAYDIDLMLLLRSSRLIGSFPDPLPTFERIGLAIYSQELRLKGKYDALIGDAPSKDRVQLWAFEKQRGFGQETKESKSKPPTQRKGFLRRLFLGKAKSD